MNANGREDEEKNPYKKALNNDHETHLKYTKGNWFIRFYFVVKNVYIFLVFC
jgi:hypothetical protein